LNLLLLRLNFVNGHILLAVVVGKLHIEADSFDILVAGMAAVVAAVGMEAAGAVVARIEVADRAAAVMHQV
jgi:hypothetical protein